MNGVAPKVSVLMPVFNPHPAYFQEAIESVISQTFPDWELVIVEDPSSVSAREITCRYKDGRIRHLLNAHRTSLVSQRNRTLEAANGKYVALLDADDVCEPTRLQEQYTFLENNERIDVLGTQKSVIGPNGERLGSRSYPRHHDEIARAMRRYNAIAQSSVMMRKSVVLEAGGYKYDKFKVGEDYELWLRLLQRGVRFENHMRTLLRYRIQPAQTKAAQLREHLQSSIDLKRTYFGPLLNRMDRARILAEQLLMHVPPHLVMKLFVAVTYKQRPDWDANSR